ncbi:MAG TPA: hypothetical protein VI248_18190 [Kineosporiaceae bacterium]
MSGRPVQRDLAAAALVLTAGIVLYGGLGFAYGVAEEYGSDVSGASIGPRLVSVVLGGGLVGVLAWPLLWAAMRLIGRRVAGPVVLGVIVSFAIVGVAVAGLIGVWRHDQGEARARVACIPTRVAAFDELHLPYTIAAPMGNRGGTCSDTFVVPGTVVQVDARIDARLQALGWARVDPGSGPVRHYRRGDLRLSVRDEGDIGGTGNVMVSMVIG